MKPVLALLTLAALAPAAERQFTYTLESNVLAPKEKEIEIQTTHKAGRDYYYRASEQKFELEVGVAPHLQAAVYLVFASENSKKDGEDLKESDTVKGWAGELKYQLTDAAADPIGSALYGELYLGAHETKGEGKLILDRQVGDWLAAINLVAEVTQDNDPDVTHPELEANLVGGLSKRLGSGLSAGLEGQLVNEWVNEDNDGYEREKSVISAGPVIHWANDALWASATVMPQIVSLKKPEDGGRLDLDHAERIQARLIVGTHF